MKAIAAACLLLAASCAPGYSYSAAVQPQHCAPGAVDPEAPGLAGYLDLRAAQPSLTTLPLPAGSRALLSIGRDPTADSVAIEVFHPQLNEAATAAVRQALAPFLRPGRMDDHAAWGAISSGPDGAVVPLSGAVECMPSPLDPAAMYATFVGALPRPGGTHGRAVLRARVEMSGEVGEIRMHRSSGSRNVDEAARQAASTATFRPATIDGLPIPVWVELPFEVRRRPF